MTLKTVNTKTKLCFAHRQRYPFIRMANGSYHFDQLFCVSYGLFQEIFHFPLLNGLIFVHQFQFNNFSIKTNILTHQPSTIHSVITIYTKKRKTINRTHEVCMPNNQISNCQKQNGINRPKIR